MTRKRSFNTNLIKETWPYTTQEVAELFKVHKRTVQAWYKEGLPRIDKQKPSYVRGSSLKEFIKTRQNNRKHHCRPFEFFCFKCREPKPCWENTVDITILNEKRLMISGLCAQCETRVNKTSSPQKLEQLEKTFNIQTIHDKHLIGCISPIVKTDINEGQLHEQI